VSKRILTPATTTFHTQVSTQVYSAPEVLGLDSNSETSNYTNSIDIWSLGCVIYELLIGTKLFLAEGQVSRYYFGKWPFPEDKLIGLSPPISVFGVSLLKSMLEIQPEDRPTAADALRNPWLTELKNDSEGSGGDKDEGTLSRKRKNGRAIYNEPKRRSGRNLTTQQGAVRRASLAGGARSETGCDPTTGESALDPSMMTLSASTESLARATRSKSTKSARQKQIGNIAQECHPSRTQNTTLTLLTKRIANENSMINPRPSTSDPHGPDHCRGNYSRSTPETNNPTEHISKTIPRVRTSILNETTSKITRWGTHTTPYKKSSPDGSDNSEGQAPYSPKRRARQPE